MRCNNLVSGPAHALYRVFVIGTASPTAGARSFQQQTHQTFPLRCLGQDPAHLRIVRLGIRSHSTSVRPEFDVVKDDQIEGYYVQCQDEGGGLRHPVSKQSLLRSLQPKQHLVQVASAMGDRPAICKIMTDGEIYQQKKARVEAWKQQNQRGKTAKQLELNWSIDPHDLAHRLNKLQEFLEKGQKVDIVMARKKKSRWATEEEKQTLVDKVRHRLSLIAGVTDYNPPKGNLKSATTLFVERKPGATGPDP